MRYPTQPFSNLLFVSYYYPPSSAVGGLRIDRFARFLRQTGYGVRVLAAHPDTHSPDTDLVRFIPPKDYSPSLGDKVEILTARVIHKALDSYPDHLEWVPPARSAALNWLHQEAAQVVLSSFPPIANHLVALELKKRLNLRWIADFRDPLLNSPFRKGHRRHFDAWAEQRVFAQADAILTVTDALAEEWKARYPAAASRIHVIWNGYDPEEPFGPAPRPLDRTHHLMIHAGDLYGERHPGRLLQSLERLFASGRLIPDHLRLRLIGPIENPKFLALPAFQNLLQSGVIETNGQRVPREQALRATAEADQVLLLDLNSEGVGHTVPAKLFDYVRAGHPMLVYTYRNSAVDGIIQKAGIPYRAVYPDDSDETADGKVLEFYQLPVHPSPPSTWFEEHFNGRRQVETLAALVNELAGVRPAAQE